MAGPLIYTVGRVIADLYAEEMRVPLSRVASFRKYVGGSSANTAVGLARLGCSVGLIARVGSDPMGDFIREKLQQEGIDTAMLVTDRQLSTGLAFAALFPPSDSQVWFVGTPNANANLSPVDIDAAQLQRAQVIVMAGTALASDSSRSACHKIIQIAQQAGIAVVFDVDWRPVFWQDASVALKVYQDILPQATVVLANETELAFVGQSGSMEEATANLLSLGVPEVVAKRGGEGSWYFSATKSLFMPPFSVEVVNTLGAGDGFGAGYTYGLAQGWEPRRRLQLAAACGALVVSRHSCSEAMPYMAEVMALIQAREGNEDG